MNPLRLLIIKKNYLSQCKSRLLHLSAAQLFANSCRISLSFQIAATSIYGPGGWGWRCGRGWGFKFHQSGMTPWWITGGSTTPSQVKTNPIRCLWKRDPRRFAFVLMPEGLIELRFCFYFYSEFLGAHRVCDFGLKTWKCTPNKPRQQ